MKKIIALISAIAVLASSLLVNASAANEKRKHCS